MRTCGPSLFPWLPALLLLSFSLHAAEAAGTTEHPGEHLDSMGSYHFKNRLQCQNLCRYHRLCQRYSYRQLEAPGSEEENCVLHADIGAGSGSGAALPPGWTGDTPPSSGSGVDCLSQPCGDTEFCAPSRTSPFYKCLPQPAPECPPYIDFANGTADVSGTQEGDVATLHCHPHFAFFPGVLENETATCLLTSHWTEPSRQCKQIIFDQLTTPVSVELPETGVSAGWSMCIQATFPGPDKFTINIREGDGSSYFLHIDFRHDLVLWNTRVNSRWQTEENLGSFPLTHGEQFNLTIQHNGSSVQILFAGHQPLSIPMGNRLLELSVTDNIEMSNGLLLDRVSLYHTC